VNRVGYVTQQKTLLESKAMLSSAGCPNGRLTQRSDLIGRFSTVLQFPRLYLPRSRTTEDPGFSVNVT
jgi:hypothetical protein